MNAMDHAQAITQLRARLDGRVSVPGEASYTAAVSIWAYSDRAPKAVAHCRQASDVQRAIAAAREAGMPLSVRAGGHDWAGRALCDGLVIDLSAMRDVALASDGWIARVGGGARAADLLAHTDPRGLAPVTGSVSCVGLSGLTLGGGYGPVIGHYGLACDNLVSAQVVLADGSIVTASEQADANLLWALRGGGGNFGVVTSMDLVVHSLPSVRTGMILYPFEQADQVFARASDIVEHGPDELSLQLGLIPGPDGTPFVGLAPTWSGRPEDGEAQVAPLQDLGTPVMADVRERPYGDACRLIDALIVDGRRTTMTTRWLPRLTRDVSRVLIQQIAARPSPQCSVVTHQLRGVASRVAASATAFGHREPHVLLEITAHIDRAAGDGAAERAWAHATAELLAGYASPGAYANLAAGYDPARANASFGPNARKLIETKRHYDPTNLFASAISLPTV
jgi:FAD/FMN-containing dehydrogenase